MKKNYYQALFLGSLLTLTSTYSFGQEKDSVKTKNIEEVNLAIGSRNKNRVSTDSTVPIDVISIAAQGVLSPQTDLNQILNFTAPSFTSNSTTVADGTDHIDPAQLRGLGPDQVLVLLNGKRRHSSSLVNINGSPGRGSVGTDLNAIPAFAIDRLEVLRDGASAQYGSDAIAGVINVVMKKNTGQLTAALTAGGNRSSGSNDFEKGWDGDKFQLDLNYGTKLGNNGFINFTGSLLNRGDNRRAMPAGGKIYNAYNAIEKRALENGVNISSLFSNINPAYNPNATQILNYIRQYEGNVGYFTPGQRTAIQNAATIGAMQTALNFDVTENELAYRGTERKDFNMRVGQSKLQSGQFYVNSEFDLTSTVRGYAFGGYSMRKGDAGGFFRRPNQNRTSTSIYLDGFLPEIHSDIVDVSLAAGAKGKIGHVNWDLSNTFGRNSFAYSIENTANATMKHPSKTIFDAGELAFSQNTINADFDTKVDWLQGLNLAFGAEGRFENFEIVAGEESSWARYDYLGNLYTSPNQVLPTDFFGSTRPGGAQVFPGYRPENALDKNRTSFALYSDNELDITEKWLLSGAVRFENYSDFGSTFNYKIATRYKITEDINFRGALSTGFRAPSLHQIYFNSTSTQFVGGIPFEVGIFSNDSKLAGLLGIDPLKQERSASYSAGFTAKIPQAKLSLTVDGYYIKIKDRITLTDQFSPTTLTQQEFNDAGATAAAFFANAIDTQTKGIEAVVSQKLNFSKFKLSNDFAVTVSKTNRIGDIHSSTKLKNSGQEGRYFSESSRVYLEEASPRFKMSLNNVAEFNKLSLLMRNVYFGKVTDPNSADVDMNGTINADEHPVWAGKLITDLSASYKFNKMVSLTLGSNNVFDVYPDKNLDALSNDNQFVYSRNVSQFGMNGRFLFVRANLTF